MWLYKAWPGGKSPGFQHQSQKDCTGTRKSFNTSLNFKEVEGGGGDNIKWGQLTIQMTGTEAGGVLEPKRRPPSWYGKCTFITAWRQNGFPWDVPRSQQLTALADTRCGQDMSSLKYRQITIVAVVIKMLRKLVSHQHTHIFVSMLPRKKS